MSHESILFRQLISTLKKFDIALADRGFCWFHSFWNLSQAGIDALMRLSVVRKVDFRKGVKLGPNDRLITLKKPAQCPKGCTREEYDALPATLILRHLKLTVSARGHRTQTIVLVTMLADPVAYPAPELGGFYFQRWSVELNFREIKITLGMDVLRCQTPGMVEKEVMMHAISYNLIRALMQEAAIRHQVDLARISIKGTVDTLRHWSASLEALRGMPRKQQALLDSIFELIAKDLVPLRPDREEPRRTIKADEDENLLIFACSEKQSLSQCLGFGMGKVGLTANPIHNSKHSFDEILPVFLSCGDGDVLTHPTRPRHPISEIMISGSGTHSFHLADQMETDH